MPDHFWQCPACGESNPPYAEVCRSCQKPAETGSLSVPPGTITKIADRLVPGSSTAPPDRVLLFRFSETSRLPLWKKIVAAALWVIELVALIVFAITFNFFQMAVSAAAFVAAEAIYRHAIHDSHAQ